MSRGEVVVRVCVCEREREDTLGGLLLLVPPTFSDHHHHHNNNASSRPPHARSLPLSLPLSFLPLLDDAGDVGVEHGHMSVEGKIRRRGEVGPVWVPRPQVPFRDDGEVHVRERLVGLLGREAQDGLGDDLKRGIIWGVKWKKGGRVV
jgi:hypothetical protein